MGKLPQDHPEIYEKFMQGHLVVKQNNREFNAVAPDMKLEQAIQRSKKGVKQDKLHMFHSGRLCTMKFLP